MLEVVYRYQVVDYRDTYDLEAIESDLRKRKKAKEEKQRQEELPKNAGGKQLL